MNYYKLFAAVKETTNNRSHELTVFQSARSGRKSLLSPVLNRDSTAAGKPGRSEPLNSSSYAPSISRQESIDLDDAVTKDGKWSEDDDDDDDGGSDDDNDDGEKEAMDADGSDEGTLRPVKSSDCDLSGEF